MESVGVLTEMAAKVGLGVVLALAATAAARHLHLARSGWRPAKGALRVMETAALGQNRAVHLVVVGRRVLLVASTPGQIVMLADVTGEQEATPGEAAAATRKTNSRRESFASVLGRLFTPPRSEQAGEHQVQRLRAAADVLRATGARVKQP